MPATELDIDAALAGQTLAAVVRRMHPGASWTQVRQAIASRRVRVNASVCLEHARRLTLGEHVTLLTQSAPPPPRPSALHLPFLDEHLVIVEKPAGVLSERRHEEIAWDEHRKAKQPTLDELLLALLRQRPPQPPSPHRPPAPRPPSSPAQLPAGIFPVHRLDRATSGLMVYARTPAARDLLVKLFAAHQVDRQYLAVVRGHPSELTLRSQLVRDRGDGLRGSLAEGELDPAARPAITHISPVQPIGPYCLIRCRLETGRTHQIRIHLHEAGYPLCGDTLYNHRLGEPTQRDESGAPRLALHSTQIAFLHPLTRQPLRFESPLPRDLAAWLDRLRQQPPAQPV